MAPQRYTRKSFTQEEWVNKVARDRQTVPSHSSNSTSEVAIPRLLLNFFIINGHEDAACRMAKELGYVRTNKDLLEFNGLFKIAQRAKVMHLLKLGQISAAMEVVNAEFGTGILQDTELGPATTSSDNVVHTNSSEAGMGSSGSCNSDNHHATSERKVSGHSLTGHEAKSMSQTGQDGASGTGGGSDLHFKLLLLNLIEMIRNKNRTTNDTEFILNLVNYTKEKLAPRALNNTTHMKQLELIMTLLLIPQGLDVELPSNLKKLYSVSLRTKIATLINQKLLKSIYPAVTAQTKFPSLLQSMDTMELLRSRMGSMKRAIKTNIQPADLQKKFYNDDEEEHNPNPSSAEYGHEQGSRGTSSSVRMGSVTASGIIADTTSRSHTSVTTGRAESASASGSGYIPGSAATDTTTGLQTLSSINDTSTRPASSINSTVPVSESTMYWTQTCQSASSTGSDRPLEEPLSEELVDFQFESKLSQIIKLWAWCENELHANNIGVPRVQTGKS